MTDRADRIEALERENEELKERLGVSESRCENWRRNWSITYTALVEAHAHAAAMRKALEEQIVECWTEYSSDSPPIKRYRCKCCNQLSNYASHTIDHVGNCPLSSDAGKDILAVVEAATTLCKQAIGGAGPASAWVPLIDAIEALDKENSNGS